MPVSEAAESTKAHSNGNSGALTQPRDASNSLPVATYAERLKGLSNCEVWTQVETAIQTLRPSADAELPDWGRFRALLDELRWRLSGLEGSGSQEDQVLTIEEHRKPH